MDISNSISINAQFIVASSSGLTPPLDDYTGAQTAYSIARKLRTAYAGSAIRVRESSGDTELDIGFDGDGNLDETALLAHTGSNNGFIVKAYDQSGNSNDWVQATAGLQPRIVLSGVVDKINSKPAIVSDLTAASQDFLTSTFTGASSTDVFHVYKNTQLSSVVATSSTTGAYYGLAQAAAAAPIGVKVGTTTLYVNSVSVSPFALAMRTATYNIQTVVYIGMDLSDALWSEVNTNFPADSIFPIEYIQETIIYNSDKSSDRAAIETNINDYYAIY